MLDPKKSGGRNRTHKQRICHFTAVPHCSLYQVPALTNIKISNLAADSLTHSPRGSRAAPVSTVLLCRPLAWLMHIQFAVDYNSYFQLFFYIIASKFL